MKATIIILVVSLLVTASCTSTGQIESVLPVPSSWNLVSFGKPGNEIPLMPDTMATLEFDDSGKLNGSGGCNEFSAKYEIQGSNLVITDIVSTLVASCMDDRVASQEMQFYNALAGTSGYEISGDKLTIFYDNGQNQLNFTKQ